MISLPRKCEKMYFRVKVVREGLLAPLSDLGERLGDGLGELLGTQVT